MVFARELLLLLPLLLSPVFAADYPFDVTTLSAPDGSVSASFVSFGATLTELWVKDRDGNARDVVLGYDDNSQLLTDPAHPVFSPIVGRYANRIRNGTFSIPISRNPDPNANNTYVVPHDGAVRTVPLCMVVSMDGIAEIGKVFKVWCSDMMSDFEALQTISEKTKNSVTYKHFDAADEGFPGNVTVYAKHEVANGGILRTSVHAEATELTPIMVTQHIYWNLDAFQDGTDTILNHTLQLNADKVIEVDNDTLPTGNLIDVEGTPFDFREAQEIGARWDDTIGLCGVPFNCQGYDHDWLYEDQSEAKKTGTSLWSDKSGIRVDITTNQQAVQVYTSFWMNTPRKVVHGGPNVNYTKWSAVAIEQQSWVDAINEPEWAEYGVDQIYGPERPYYWTTTYQFSTVD